MTAKPPKTAPSSSSPTWRRHDGYEDIMYENCRRRHREDHDQPAGGAQRVSPADRQGDDPRVRRRARRRRRRRRHPDAARATTRSAPAATSACAARVATSATTAFRGSTCSICSGRSARCPSPSSRWSRATRSAAATCSTSSAISRSPPTTRASARPARGSAASTAASARRTSRASSGRRRRARSGSSAGSTTRSRRCEMGLVNTVVPLAELEAETVQWCREMLEHCPDRAALPEGGAERRLRRPGRPAGSSPAPRRCSSTTTDEGKEGKEAFLEKRERRTSRSSSASHERASRVGDRPRGRGPETLPRRVVPVAVGTACAEATRRGRVWGRRSPRSSARS